MFKPCIIHEDHLPPEAVEQFEHGFYFKNNGTGLMDKASLDYVLDCLAEYVLKLNFFFFFFG